MKVMIATMALALAASVGIGGPHPTGAAATRGPALLAMPDMPLHDPWIVADRGSGTYFLFTSNVPRMTGDPGPGIMVYVSRDLARWTRPRVVFTLPSATWASAGGWAPEVHRWHGRWYLLATFHNEASKLPAGDGRRPFRRGTLLAVSDALGGPFRLVRGGAPVVEASRMTLDGTLYVDPSGRPWLVYAHEWVQIGDGTIEAVPLDDDLAAAGAPEVLFHASEAPWIRRSDLSDPGQGNVTDGPELFRTRKGDLLMLWSSYDAHGYVQALARSRTGRIGGPWEQLPPLVRRDSGHGMLFRRFDGSLMMVLHHPFNDARGRLYVMRDDGSAVSVVREATELDGAGGQRVVPE